ncbi:FAD-dependent oxidoreductase [Mycobacterium adipatum]|uniref:FAD-dependent oxidoreductase n=1 Tax=Mycobacterium adipatum TaxID=1682113 RepID=UPI0034E08347
MTDSVGPRGPQWDSETDVVVLGSGGAGLAAALTAAASGAAVAIYEKAATVGGTTAVSGGITWIPAHDRLAGADLSVGDALKYLEAQSLGAMDRELVETFVRTGPAMLNYLEQHSDLRFDIAEGFPDYKPELPGGRPGGGRSLAAAPFDLAELGEWGARITAFPVDFSNVGIDAETKARIHATVDESLTEPCVAGTALIAGLLKGLLDRGVEPVTEARAVELLGSADGIVGVRINHGGKDIRVRARRAVILATGGFEWDPGLVEAYLRGPMRGAVSPPNNTGDGLRMAMAHGADLANMGEAWWVPIVQIPGDTLGGKPRSRSVRLERTRPRSIIVNRAGKRFLNEAGEYNSMAGPFHHLDPRAGYLNDPAWIVFDAQHLKRYGFLGIDPDGPAPEWFNESPTLEQLADKIGVDPAGLVGTVDAWNSNVEQEHDPDFGRGASAYDGYWGDPTAASPALQTLGPLDTAPFYAVPVAIGAMGTKGGPRTDRDGRVLHVSGKVIPGLFAAGNAMAGVTGKAYGGAGGTLGPAMTFGYRSGYAAATGESPA